MFFDCFCRQNLIDFSIKESSPNTQPYSPYFSGFFTWKFLKISLPKDNKATVQNKVNKVRGRWGIDFYTKVLCLKKKCTS